MDNKEVEAIKDEIFNKINECLEELDTRTGSDIQSTNHIFDVLEEVMARAIAGCSGDLDNLVQIEKGVSERVLSLAKVIYHSEFAEK